MKLLFKQRFFSWFDSYDIYDENHEVFYTVEGKLSWGHKLVIYNKFGEEIGMLKEVVLTWMPKYEVYIHGKYIGTIKRRFTFFHPVYNIDFSAWEVGGDFMGWDYTISSQNGNIASISKELLHWTDTYVIDVPDPGNALMALMVVLAIDADKCSHG